MGNLKVIIQHSLPGRLRLKLTKPPLRWSENSMNITKHNGISSVFYSPVTRTILIYFDTKLITKEEIVMRAGLALSVEYNLEPVVIEQSIKDRGLDGMVYFSGAAILAGAASHILNINTIVHALSIRKFLHILAGASTAVAVLNHALKEVNRTGVFDPETLSIFYLLPSLVKKNVLPASAITWLASFGRHFLSSSDEHLILKAVEVNLDDKEPTYDITITNYKKSIGYSKILKMIPILIADGFFGLGIGKARMLQNMKNVSSNHNYQLEGLEGTNSRILIKI